VVIRGRRRPVLGRVTMNFLMVDASDSDVCEGDTAVLLGEDGGASVWADELAAWCGTIPYEILTRIRVRERRVV
jgi:alanine racemase